MFRLSSFTQGYSLKTTKQQLAYIKIRAIVISIGLSILAIASIIFFVLFFGIQTQRYYDSTARTRIKNGSTDIIKNMNNILDECFYDVDSFNNILSETKITNADNTVNMHLVNERIQSYSNLHIIESIGILKDNCFYLKDQTLSLPETITYSKNQGNVSFPIDDDIYYISPAKDSLPSSIIGIVGRVPKDVISTKMETTIYNSNASIMITDDMGTIQIVSSINHENAMTGNVFDNMANGVTQGFPSYEKEYKRGETYIAEDLVAGEVTMIYHQIINDDSNNQLHFLYLVPKAELTSMIKSYSALISAILYTVLALSTITILLFVNYTTRLYVKNKHNEAYDKTGLLNHETFLHDVGAVLCTSSEEYAVACLNIRDFTKMNTIFGTDRADKLLKSIADVLNGLLTDDGELCGHSRGDKFMLLLKGSKDEIIYKQNAIENALLSNEEVMRYNPVFNIGIKMTNAARAAEAREEYNAAIFALKKNENNQKEHFSFFDDAMFKKQAEDNELINRFDDAIRNEEFEVYLQLKWDLKANTWGGAEALVRWRTKDKGLISPGRFIPLFESNGLITRLDQYMFEHVCKLISSMLDNGEECVKVSLNLSRRNFTDLSFMPRFREIVNSYTTPHNLIEFEITEGLLMDNVDNYKTFITEAHNNGYYVSMDDFGAGFSSLNMINELAFDTIKLDAKFFRGGFNQANQTIVANIINLCHELGKTVVAEGIESANEVEFLRSAGCDLIQGYYYAKPSPVEDFKKMLKN